MTMADLMRCSDLFATLLCWLRRSLLLLFLLAVCCRMDSACMPAHEMVPYDSSLTSLLPNSAFTTTGRLLTGVLRAAWQGLAEAVKREESIILCVERVGQVATMMLNNNVGLQ